VLVAIVSLLGLACTDPEPITAPPTTDDGGDIPAAPQFVDFTPPDNRSVPLAPIPPGKPQPTPEVEVYGGEASLRGRITYNGEPASGATIQVERFVGLNSSTVQVSSGGDGAWGAKNVKGGRYRIRAFVGQEQTLAEAVTLFLGEKEAREVPLVLIDVPRTTRTVIKATTQPTDPPVDREVMLHLTVSNETVAPDGTVEETAFVPDTEVKITSHTDWEIKGNKTGTTASNGTASFPATCKKEGTHKATIELGWITQTIDLPACGADRPETVDLPVGQTVLVPFEGPIPAGTYQTNASPCETTLEIWSGGKWGERVVKRGKTLELPDIARDLEAAPGSTPCQYRRIK
jgi:hypothetical protein